jgi:hypothetical protein
MLKRLLISMLVVAGVGVPAGIVVADKVDNHAIVTCSKGYTSNYGGGWVACSNNHSRYRARIVCQKKTSPYWQNVHYATYSVWSGRSTVYCPAGYSAAAKPTVTWW